MRIVGGIERNPFCARFVFSFEQSVYMSTLSENNPDCGAYASPRLTLFPRRVNNRTEKELCHSKSPSTVTCGNSR